MQIHIDYHLKLSENDEKDDQFKEKKNITHSKNYQNLPEGINQLYLENAEDKGAQLEVEKDQPILQSPTFLQLNQKKVISSQIDLKKTQNEDFSGNKIPLVIGNGVKSENNFSINLIKANDSIAEFRAYSPENRSRAESIVINKEYVSSFNFSTLSQKKKEKKELEEQERLKDPRKDALLNPDNFLKIIEKMIENSYGEHNPDSNLEIDKNSVLVQREDFGDLEVDSSSQEHRSRTSSFNLFSSNVFQNQQKKLKEFHVVDLKKAILRESDNFEDYYSSLFLEVKASVIQKDSGEISKSEFFCQVSSKVEWFSKTYEFDTEGPPLIFGKGTHILELEIINILTDQYLGNKRMKLTNVLKYDKLISNLYVSVDLAQTNPQSKFKNKLLYAGTLTLNFAVLYRPETKENLYDLIRSNQEIIEVSSMTVKVLSEMVASQAIDIVYKSVSLTEENKMFLKLNKQQDKLILISPASSDIKEFRRQIIASDNKHIIERVINIRSNHEDISLLRLLQSIKFHNDSEVLDNGLILLQTKNKTDWMIILLIQILQQDSKIDKMSFYEPIILKYIHKFFPGTPSNTSSEDFFKSRDKFPSHSPIIDDLLADLDYFYKSDFYNESLNQSNLKKLPKNLKDNDQTLGSIIPRKIGCARIILLMLQSVKERSKLDQIQVPETIYDIFLEERFIIVKSMLLDGIYPNKKIDITKLLFLFTAQIFGNQALFGKASMFQLKHKNTANYIKHIVNIIDPDLIRLIQKDGLDFNLLISPFIMSNYAICGCRKSLRVVWEIQIFLLSFTDNNERRYPGIFR